LAVTQFSFDVRLVVPPHTKLARFFEDLKAGKLMGTKCKKCGKLYFPPKADCSDCVAGDMDWVEVKGRGSLLTYTVTHVAPKAYVDIAPYIIGIAQLDEGPKLTAWIRGVEPRDVKVGMRLKTVVEECEDGIVRYTFKPEK